MLKYIIGGIAVIAIILFVFVRNPSGYLEKKQTEMASKVLMKHIMKHNDPDYGKKPKTPPPRTSGVDFGLDTSEDKENTDAPESFTPSTLIHRNTRGQQLRNNSMSPQVPVQPNPTPQPAPSNGGDGYYPPSSSNVSPVNPQASIEEVFHPKGFLTTKEGIQVTFAGTRPYQVDANGVRKPLKDGVYSMFNGNYKMLVMGGEQIITN